VNDRGFEFSRVKYLKSAHISFFHGNAGNFSQI
jgi:hypothetical protein